MRNRRAERRTFDETLLRKMFAQCRSAIFASRAEEARGAFAFRLSAVRRAACRACPRAPVSPEPIGALCGADEYVLVHAAVEPRANQWIAHARRRRQSASACVLVGTVENAEYYQSVIEAAGDGRDLARRGSLTPGQLEALYAGARIYADLSWAGHGAARLVRAAAHGIDSGDVSSALGLAELWPELTGGATPPRSRAPSPCCGKPGCELPPSATK